MLVFYIICMPGNDLSWFLSKGYIKATMFSLSKFSSSCNKKTSDLYLVSGRPVFYHAKVFFFSLYSSLLEGEEERGERERRERRGRREKWREGERDRGIFFTPWSRSRWLPWPGLGWPEAEGQGVCHVFHMVQGPRTWTILYCLPWPLLGSWSRDQPGHQLKPRGDAGATG